MGRRKGRKKTLGSKHPPSHEASAGLPANVCGGQGSEELPPLSEDAKRLAISVETMERIRKE